MTMSMSTEAYPYRVHLHSSDGLITTYEATRAGFVALALEKSRRATPYVEEARALQSAAMYAQAPADLLNIKGIESGLLTAAGLSDKARNHLSAQDRQKAVDELIARFLEPAGAKFVEELVFRFLLVRGDTLGGSMRNVGGVLAQRKLTRAILSALSVAGIPYQWQHAKSQKWVAMTDEDSEIEMSLRGLSWQNGDQRRTLIYNLRVPLVKSNIDLCLFNLGCEDLLANGYGSAQSYIALGELKGGIDPAGADEHWKTATSALERIRAAFSQASHFPHLFYVGAAIEKRMAGEIWEQLESGTLSNAANLNQANQVASLARWLCML